MRSGDPSQRGSRPGLVGRQTECKALDDLLVAARNGKSGVLQLLGDAGVGKTALLDHVACVATGTRVLRAGGVLSEMELPYAALQQLCGPLLGGIDLLPEPQRSALEVAFGRRDGSPPDQLAVGLAVLGLVAGAATDTPVVCLVDDTHLIDTASAQVLSFVARRLLAESVVIILAAREHAQESPLKDLPTRYVPGLTAPAARELLARTLFGRIDPRVRDQVLAEAQGNPLAIITFARTINPTDATGGFGLPSPGALVDRIERAFNDTLTGLPPEVHLFLVVAAADPTGDPALLWRAMGALEITVDDDLIEAVDSILEIDSTVRFRHPLMRSAVYKSASPRQRMEAHRALARSTDGTVEPDRRAWHTALGTMGPDEKVAGDLESSASRARARGGLAAAAAFLERSALLTADTALRSSRMLSAAQARLEAGGPATALTLLSRAEAGLHDELHRARSGLLQAQIAFATEPESDTTAKLLAAARRLETLDAPLARTTYLDALAAATVTGRLASGAGLHEVAAAARHAPPPTGPAGASDLLLDGLALTITEGHLAGGPVLRRALTAFADDDLNPRDGLRWLWFAGHTALALMDDAAWDDLSARHVRLAREAGALGVLSTALNTRVGAAAGLGELEEADRALDEAASLAEATGSRLSAYVGLAPLALRGREEDLRQAIHDTEISATQSSEGIGLTVAYWAEAIHANAQGRYEAAFGAAERTASHPEELWASGFGGIELVEAAARTGRRELAVRVLDTLSEHTRAYPTNLAAGLEARGRGVVTDGPTAASWFESAIELLSRTRVRVELARAHLLYGEWLRRARRRSSARTQLRTAHDMFTSIGMEAFARRAANELAVAGGQTIRTRAEASRAGELTAQEARVARLARERLTNPEIGSRLYISPRTVEYHLRNVFVKLGITSRHELATALSGS